MNYRIIAVIKPTKNNKEVMKKVKLFSNTHWLIFDVYNAMLEHNVIEIDSGHYDFILEELTKLGVKY